MANTIQDLMVRLGLQSDGMMSGLDQVQAKTSGFASRMTGILSGISFVGFNVSAIAASEKFTAAFASIQRSTGATEEKLKGLEESFANVYKQTAASSEAVSSTLALLSTRTQATGKDLEDLTLKTLKLAKTQSEDVATIVPVVTRMFGDWSISTDRQAKNMDYLRVVSQQTGVHVSKISEEVAKQGPVLRGLGYSWEGATALIARFEKESGNTEAVLGAMRKALGAFAKENESSADAWKRLVAGVQAGTISYQKFLEIAGNKGGVYLFDAIRAHKTDVDALVQSYQQLETQGGKGVETLRTQLIKFQHSIEAGIGAHRDLIMVASTAMPVLTSLSGVAKTAGESIAASGIIANAGWATLAVTLGAAAAAIATITYSISTRPKTGEVAGFVPGMAAEQRPPTPRGAPSAPEWAFQIPRHATPEELAKIYGSGTPGGGTPPPTPTDFRPFKELSDALAVVVDQEHLEVAAHKAVIQETAAFNEAMGSSIQPLDYLAIKTALASEANRQFAAGAGDLGAAMTQRVAPAGKSLADTMATVAESLRKADQQALDTSGFAARAEALRYFGITSKEKYEEIANDAQKAYNKLRDSGKASDLELTIAHLEMLQAFADADRAYGRISEDVWEKITEDIKQQLDKIDGKHSESAKKRKQIEHTLGDDLAREWKGIFESFERNLADNIIHWKGWSDTLKKLGEDLASSMLTSFLKGLFKPLEDQMANLGKKIGDVFGKIWGSSGAASGGTTTAGGAASGGGGIGGAASAASSLTNILGIANLAVNIASGITSGVQQAHMSSDLQKIEKSTRYTEIYTGEQTDSLLATSHKMRDSLTGILAALQGVVKINLDGKITSEEANDLINKLINGSYNFYQDSAETLTQLLQATTSGFAQVVGQLHAIGKDLNPSFVQRLMSSFGPLAMGGITSGIGGALGSATSGLGGIGSALGAGLSSLIPSSTKSDLGNIEVNTRAALNEALNFRRDQWDQWGKEYDRLGEIWNSIRESGANLFTRLGEVQTALMNAFTGGASSISTEGGAINLTFSNCTFGSGLSQQQVNDMMTVAMRQAALAGGG